MENAGRNAADLIEGWVLRRRSLAGGRRPPRVGIVCGKGNNGGDGFVIARHLAIRGLGVSVDLLADPESLSPDAAVNFRIVSNLGIAVRVLAARAALRAAVRRWRSCDALVDALLGTGFAGRVRSPMAEVIDQINKLTSALIVAIDVPSGLNADTGDADGPAVRADRTVTFMAMKAGFVRPAARRYLGRVTVVGIGAPPVAIRRQR